MKEAVKPWTLQVRGVDREIYNLFAAACKIQHRQAKEVLDEIMWEYANRFIKRQDKPRA